MSHSSNPASVRSEASCSAGFTSSGEAVATQSPKRSGNRIRGVFCARQSGALASASAKTKKRRVWRRIPTTYLTPTGYLWLRDCSTSARAAALRGLSARKVHGNAIHVLQVAGDTLIKALGYSLPLLGLLQELFVGGIAEK